MIAGTDALGPAFDFVVELARSTDSLIEVLYVDCRDGERHSGHELIDQLSNLGYDFQMTYLKGNLMERMAEYNAQRQDIMAIVSSASEEFAQKLCTTSNPVGYRSNLRFPSVLLIGGYLTA